MILLKNILDMILQLEVISFHNYFKILIQFYIQLSEIISAAFFQID